MKTQNNRKLISSYRKASKARNGLADSLQNKIGLLLPRAHPRNRFI